MFPIFPVIATTVIFTATAWGINKAVEKITGKDINDNLDSAYDKVLAFVHPAETKPVTPVAPVVETLPEVEDD